jgi:hypothetical protein
MIFQGSPFLLMALGLFAAPLLLRQLQFNQLGRTWWVLPLLGLLPGAALTLLEMLVPLNATSGFAAYIDLELQVFTAFAVLVLLNALLDGSDRELIELSLTLPGVLFMPHALGTLLPSSLAYPHLVAGALGGLLLLALVFLMTGLQERFRRNAAPGSLEGLPFRVAILALILFIALGFEALMKGTLH